MKYIGILVIVRQNHNTETKSVMKSDMFETKSQAETWVENGKKVVEQRNKICTIGISNIVLESIIAISEEESKNYSEFFNIL